MFESSPGYRVVSHNLLRSLSVLSFQSNRKPAKTAAGLNQSINYLRPSVVPLPLFLRCRCSSSFSRWVSCTAASRRSALSQKGCALPKPRRLVSFVCGLRCLLLVIRRGEGEGLRSGADRSRVCVYSEGDSATEYRVCEGNRSHGGRLIDAALCAAAPRACSQRRPHIAGDKRSFVLCKGLSRSSRARW